MVRAGSAGRRLESRRGAANGVSPVQTHLGSIIGCDGTRNSSACPRSGQTRSGYTPNVLSLALEHTPAAGCHRVYSRAPMTYPHAQEAAAPRGVLPSLALAFVAYTALAIVITFPLVLHLPSHLPRDLGDPRAVTAILRWNARVLPFTDRWWEGFGFFPVDGMMAFSEHFVGASLIASPLQWAGLSGVSAYNVTFLASFPLCAVAAHALGLALTRRHDAAALCGLGYGFTPIRIGHLEHLELLLGYGMPLALAALHRYADTQRPRWLLVFGLGVLVQALSTSYYGLFFTIFFGLWLVWFMRPSEWRKVTATTAAAATAALILSPVVLEYRRIHDRFTWRRDLNDELLRFSADLSSFVSASPFSAIWGWTASPMNGAERQLFPGLTVTALAGAGVLLLVRAAPHAPDRRRVVSSVCWALAATLTVVALGAGLGGPWQVGSGWLRVSVTVWHKPLSLAFALAGLALASGPTCRAAIRGRSALAFYLVAAATFFLCSLGPQPSAWGERFLYQPPYAWLMRLPLFGDSVRVPARFSMLMALALAVAGSLAAHHLTAGRPQRRKLLSIAAIAIIAEGWIWQFPLTAVPRRDFDVRQSDQVAAVVELPLGDVYRDTAAMHRATRRDAPTVNGYNGFEPIYYQTLRRALAERDLTILDALASLGPLLIAVDNRAGDPAWRSFVEAHHGVQYLRQDGPWTMYRLAKAAVNWPAGCQEIRTKIRAVFAARGRMDSTVLTDQNPSTQWSTPGPQQTGDSITLDLGRPQRPCGIEMSLGDASVLYPKAFRVEASEDGNSWHTLFAEGVGGRAFLAQVQSSADARINVPIVTPRARFLRLSVSRSDEVYPWAIAEVAVHGEQYGTIGRYQRQPEQEVAPSSCGSASMERQF